MRPLPSGAASDEATLRGMTRTLGTITWGLALLLSAIVLAWQQSIPWALATAGAVALIVGLIKAVPVWLAPEDGKGRKPPW